MIYTYYAQLFAENPHLFHWAGAARTAGGPVYAGLSDSERGHAIGAAAFNASNPIPALQALKELLSAYGMGLADAASAYVDSQVTVIQQNFMAGAQNIFNDLAWQHRAYAASGIWALRHVDQNPAPLSNGEIPFNLDPWNALWKIDYTGDASTLFDEVVKPLAEREQHDLIQQEWNLIRERGGYELPPILSHLARSPYPGKMKFIKFAELIEAPGNDISLYADRWLWINHDDPSGVMQDFNAFTETYRFGFVMRALRDHAEDMKLIGTLIWEQ